MAAWGGMIRELGQSVVALLRLEITALTDDLARSGRAATDGLVLAAVAFAFAFWTVGALAALVVSILAIWLPVWAAALVLFLLLLGATGGAAWRSQQRLRRVENPVTTVTRHVDDHLAWWQDRLARITPEETAGAISEEASALGGEPAAPPADETR